MKGSIKRINKKVIGDMALNLIATAIPTLALQLIILPLLGGRMSSDLYGLLVTILALLNVVPSTFGNTLNNIRLIYNKKYTEKGIVGDFNALLILFGVVNAIIVGTLSWFYDKKINFLSMLLTILIAITWMAKEYYAVSFRLEINYIKI